MDTESMGLLGMLIACAVLDGQGDEQIEICDAEGVLVYRGAWHEAGILEYADRKGFATYDERKRLTKFRLV